MDQSKVSLASGLNPAHPAVALALAGRIDDAVESCRLSAERHMSQDANRRNYFVDALCGTALICAQSNQKVIAEDMFRRAIAAAPFNYVANAHLGAILMARGRYDEAVIALETALTADSEAYETLLNLGHALVSSGRAPLALPHFERAMVFGPKRSETYGAMGDILVSMGQLDQAIARYEQALALRPDNPAVLNSLGIILLHLGRTDEASQRFAQMVDVLSQSADNDALCVALGNLGAMLNQVGHHAEALEILERAWRLQPENLSIISNLSASLSDLGRNDQVVELCTQALARGPVPFEIHNNLANAYKAGGNSDAALRHYRLAVDAAPQNPKIWVNLGSAALHGGRIEQAADAFRHAIALAPHDGNAHRLLSAVHHYAEPDEHLALMERVLAELPPDQRMELHFALGKAYDDLGRYDDAFGQFQLGNRLKRGRVVYDEAATMALFDAMPQRVSREDVAQAATGGHEASSPIFIIGMPRSGTTLVEQILSCLPGNFALGERMDFQDCITRWGADYHALGAAYVKSIAADAPGAKRTIDKMMSNSFYAGVIHLALPQARIIHVRRNPIDTCLSCYSLLFNGDQQFAYDLAELGRYYRRYDQLMAYWRHILPPRVFLEVEYEALVADFESQARRIVAFCDLPWSADCLSFHKSERVVLTASAAQVRQPLYQSSVGRRLHYLPFLGPLIAALEEPG